jgi:hypothetical protein
MTENLTDEQVRILSALRSASALRRVPAPLRPDGILRWWTLSELIYDGRLPEDGGTLVPASLSSAARSLKRKGLVISRTQFTVVRWMITDQGRAALRHLEEQAGVSGTVKAELDFEQAKYDLELAESQFRVLRAVVTKARTELGRPVIDVVLGSMREEAR